MPRPLTVSYAAFLRAVNVGTHNRVRMEDVREALAGLGSTSVRTYLATGNIALSSAEPAETVARRLEEALAGLGLRDVDVMVRSRDELATLAGDVFDEYPSADYRHLAVFTRRPVEIPDRLPLAHRGLEVVAVGAALLGVIRRDAPRPVDANAVVESIWRTRATTRWWNVVDHFRRDVLG